VLELVAPRHRLALRFEEIRVGGAAIDAHGAAIRPEDLVRVEAADAVLLGAVGRPALGRSRGDGPAGAGPLRASPRPRPVREPSPGARRSGARRRLAAPRRDRGRRRLRRRSGADGRHLLRPPERAAETPAGREAVDTTFYSEAEVVRLMRAAFALARQRRKRVTSVDKANVLATSRLWREVAHEVAREHPDVAFENVLVDAMAMHLLRRPRDFDVIATENLFGDILTDEASMLTGSMGLLPSASLPGMPAPGERLRGLYEPIHGSAPDIAGQDRANPLAAILSTALCCRYSLGAPEAAAAIEAAVAAVVAAGRRTADIAAPGERTIGCREMGRLVREALGG
jgi:3-isopropylmalate dehydrogenase